MARAKPQTESHEQDGLVRLLNALPGDPVGRGKDFERLAQWLLENHPLYSSQLRKVWLWNDWPGRWGRDTGIDLVAEAQDGTLWAVQAKAYAPDYSITKADVDSFLSESARPQFSYRLLISSTDRIGANALQVLRGQDIRTGMLMRTDLMDAPVKWPKSLLSLHPRKRPRKRPRPHQRRACRDVVAGLREDGRGHLVMACGTGKTLTALFAAEDLRASQILFLVPSLSLLSQVISEWTANASQTMEFMAVCSDDSVVGSDALTGSTSDLPFPVNSEPSTIAAFLRAPTTSVRVVFSTYQSSGRIAEAVRGLEGFAFDLVVADEAHRLVGRPDREFATVLKDDAIPARMRLFMTATPRRFTGRLKAIAKDRDLEVASMDDEALFGRRLHTLTFGTAIQKGLLTDYQVAIIGVDDSNHLEWAREGVFLRSESLRDMDARTLATHVGVAKAFRRFRLRRVITFHTSVDGARRFAQTHGEVMGWLPTRDRPRGRIWADFVSGAMPAGLRRSKIESLRNPTTELALLSNARCLTEGIDLPSLDGVVFVDPRRSDVDIVQAVGRAIRLSAEKTLGTIVIPVFVGSQEESEPVIGESAFAQVWDVLTALRAHDDDLASDLDALRRGLGSGGRSTVRLPTKIYIDLPEWVDARFSQSIRLKIVEKTTANWEFMYGVLQGYVQRKGTALVPQQHRERGVALGIWVNNQRVARVDMLPDRRAQLECLPGWSWDPRSDAWERAFALLVAYAEREGHSLVPADSVEADFQLGAWVGRQRSQMGVLSEERRERLSGLRGWSWDPLADAWERAFALLRDYAAREGHAQVPLSFEIDGFPLGKWVGSQRMRKQRLSMERQVRLSQIPGWTWEPQNDAWERGYALLAAFVAREGHARVLRDHLESGFNLGKWVARQRSARDTMPPERKQLLEQTPGWIWDAHAETWEAAYAQLVAYSEREGNARVPIGYSVGGLPLGRGVSRQRLLRDSLPADRRARLEQVRGWTWDPQADAWEEGYKHLKAYAEREGHAKVPLSYKTENFALGKWVAVQRHNQALSKERRARLEMVRGWTWDPWGYTWERGYELLLEFARREGHTRIPVTYVSDDGFKLGRWLSVQRGSRAEMAADRRRRLEKVPAWQWAGR